MRHQKIAGKLSRTTAHRQAMLVNLVRSLFEHDRIQTTLPRAKIASRFADRMITLAKRKDLSAQRRAARFFVDRGVVKRLFKEVGPRFEDRKGGYTRVIRLDRRAGDQAFMAILELVVAGQASLDKKARREAAASKKKLAQASSKGA